MSNLSKNFPSKKLNRAAHEQSNTLEAAGALASLQGGFRSKELEEETSKFHTHGSQMNKSKLNESKCGLTQHSHLIPSIPKSFVRKNKCSSSTTKHYHRVRTFVEKLMDLLDGDGDDTKDSIMWDPDGLSFVVTKTKIFAEEVLPRFLKKCKYLSFVRKLYRWGFRQFTNGTNAQCFYNKVSDRSDM